MANVAKFKKDKEIIAEYESQVKGEYTRVDCDAAGTLPAWLPQGGVCMSVCMI